LPEKMQRKIKGMQRWFYKDLSSTHLIWIKLIFFFQSASLVVLYPYLVIHMRSLGLSVEEVAIVNGVIPAADMIGPPMAGFIADKIGNFRLFMSALTLISGLSSLLLLLIPAKSTTYHIQNHSFQCCLDLSQEYLCYSSNFTFQTSREEFNKTSSDYLNYGLSCDNVDIDTKVYLSNSNFSMGIFTNETSDCITIDSCSGNIEGTREDWLFVLGCYISLRALIDVLRASSCMMFEGAVVVTIKTLGGDYGLQKLFGTFGAIIWGPISGQIIDMASTASGKEDYAPVFYLFFVLRFISALLILKLNLSFKKPAKKMFKNLGRLIIKPHILMFLVMFFLCGAIWGFLESYLFWYLEDLGSTKLTMGISLTIGTIAGIPLTVASGRIIKKLGNSNVIVMALMMYCFRLFGYSFINKPMESLFFEVLKPFGNSLLMIAAMTYAKNNSDIDTMASLEGVMGALYFGVGKALGSLFGGLLIEEIGLRPTFRCFSGLAFVAASLYLTFTLITEKRNARNKDAEVPEKNGGEHQDAEASRIPTDQTDTPNSEDLNPSECLGKKGTVRNSLASLSEKEVSRST